MRNARIIVLSLVAAMRVVAAAAVEHAIVVSVDGLGSVYMAPLLEAGVLPGYARLIEEGAGTLEARSDYDYTVTLPNHLDIISGRPVLYAADPDTIGHGFKINTDPGAAWTVHTYGNTNVAYVASVFDVAHDHGLSTAAYVSKDKFDVFRRSWGPDHGAPDTTPEGGDNGRNKFDVYVFDASSAGGGTPLPKAYTLVYGGNGLTGYLADLASNRWTFSFLHILDPDNGGHTYGWGSAAWSNIVVETDAYIGDLLETIETTPGLASNTVIILTADHGGFGTSHTQAWRPENYRIPFLVWGAGVARGIDLYAVNPGRYADPGDTRPYYNAAGPPAIRNGDAANLALSLLGLPSVPGSYFNVGQRLNVGDILALSDIRPAPDGGVELTWFDTAGLAAFDVLWAPEPDATYAPAATNLHVHTWTATGVTTRGFFRVEGR